MYTKFHTNFQPEVIACKKFNKLPKLMMNFHFWNTQLWQDGLTTLKRFHKSYTHTGHSVRNSPSKMASFLKGTRIVIPNKKCEAILKQILDSHLGLTKCKLHAKQAVYWPGLKNQLEQLVLNCQLCLKYLRLKKKPDTYSTLGQEVPIFHWTKVATDLFHFEGNSYLLLIDYTSQFFVMRKLTSMTAHHIADHIQQIFAEYRWPDTLVSDNGPCYTSEIFKGLMEEYQVNHITSSPHYPQSNGLAKKYIQIIKNLFHKAKEEGQDLHKCLMTYRNTPLTSHLQSPMQILSNRATRSTLPLSNAAKHVKWAYTVKNLEWIKRTNIFQHMICV